MEVEIDAEVVGVGEDVGIEVGCNAVVVVTGGGVASKLRSVFLILEVKEMF